VASNSILFQRVSYGSIIGIDTEKAAAGQFDDSQGFLLVSHLRQRPQSCTTPNRDTSGVLELVMMERSHVG
jgi:hypothetical protein